MTGHFHPSINWSGLNVPAWHDEEDGGKWRELSLERRKINVFG